MDDHFYLYPSPTRRLFSVAMMVGLGGLLIFLAAGAGEMALVWKAFMLLCGGGALAIAARSWRATQDHLVLTAETLELNTGEVICRIDEVQKVERGAFAFKPSNGFVVLLKREATAGKSRAMGSGPLLANGSQDRGGGRDPRWRGQGDGGCARLARAERA